MRALALLAGLATVVSACLYTPPGRLPSSIRVLYSKTTVDSITNSTDIYFLVARSENELRLTGEDGEDTSPTFSRETLSITFARQVEGEGEIWRMAFDGSDERRVLGEAGVDFSDPEVAPEGDRMVYVRTTAGRSAVMVSDLDGGNPVTVVEGAGWRDPAWSPDGRRLAIARDEAGGSKVYLVDTTGGTPRPVAPNAPESQDDPDWSPGGERIALTLGRGTDAEIAVVEVVGGSVTRLTDNNARDGSPSWSPNGERIVFVSRRPAGHDNLYVMNADGSDVDPLTDSETSEARDPEWL